MSNDFYNHNDGVPATLTRGASTAIRSEFDLVQAGFDKLPTLAQSFGGTASYAVAGGSADAWTVSVSPTVLTSYADGMQVRVKFPAANATTTPTININALGAKAIVAEDGTAIAAGNIALNMIATLTYNASSGKLHMTDTALAASAIATTQAGIATTQAGIAAAQAAAAAASRLAIDDRLYPGTYSVAPTTRPDSTVIQNGDRYVNSVDGYEYIRVAGVWTNAANSAQAAAVSAALAASYSAVPGAVVAALIGTELTAIAISAEEVAAKAMKVVDAANVLNNRTGGVLDVMPGVFGQPKMVTAADGTTMKWSPHNFAQLTTTPGSNITGSTAVAAQPDSDGGTTAAKLTATSATVSGFQQPSIIAAGYAGMYFMQEWIVRAGTSTFCYIAFVTGGPTYKHAWFNLSTGTLGTVDAGVTATISGTRADGTALPAGYYRVTAYYNAATAADALCGQCDADASKAVTVGRNFYGEKPFVHLGVLAMDYLANTTSALKVGVPIDYSKGGPRILMEPTVTYQSSFPDDLTNAAWVKTNATAAKTTTGPHGEPCSTLTATAGNGTAIQAVPSGTATQNFSAFVRRRTGTGTISITTDNGATWTDITSLLNSTTYTRVQAAGVANPNIGFKISTNADAIDVSMALDTNKSYMSSPLPGGGGIRAADPFIVPLTLLTAASAYTVYADYDRFVGATFPDDSNFFAGNAALSRGAWLATDSGNGYCTFSVTDGVTTKTYRNWVTSSNERLELTTKVEANKHMMSVNGEPAARITTVGMPTMDEVRLGLTAPLFLRRLLIVPRAIDKDDVRTWRYSGLVRNRTLATEIAAYDSDATVPNTTMNREPTMCVLSDDGTTADVLVFWMQKHNTGFHPEAPARLMQRKYRFNKAAATLTPLTAASVLQQQAGWASGTGHLQSANGFVVPTGTNKGRVVLLFAALETPNFTPTQESIYVMHNDAAGDPTQWTTPTRIVAAASGVGYATDPSASVVVLPPTHAIAPNRILTNYYDGAHVWSLYSDDGGTTWTSGTAFTTARVPSETCMALRPDGSIVAVHRLSNGTLSDRSWSKSTDGGVTFVDQGLLSGVSTADCSSGLVQLDPTGVFGTYGKIAFSHPVDPSTRLGVQIDIATDSAMTFGNSITPWTIIRYFGYSSIRSLFGGSHIALAVEGGSTPFNVDNCVFLALIQAR